MTDESLSLAISVLWLPLQGGKVGQDCYDQIPLTMFTDGEEGQILIKQVQVLSQTFDLIVFLLNRI